jgi:hypothetical protein
MAIFVLPVPILPGKLDQWRRFMDELNGPRYAEFVESRRQVGIRERTFFHSTAAGDMAILVWEGDDPAGAIQVFRDAHDEFSRWQVQMAQEVHGFNPNGAIPALPELVIDSERAPRPSS